LCGLPIEEHFGGRAATYESAIDQLGAGLSKPPEKLIIEFYAPQGNAGIGAFTDNGTNEVRGPVDRLAAELNWQMGGGRPGQDRGNAERHFVQSRHETSPPV
jgi:hypothetical protein